MKRIRSLALAALVLLGLGGTALAAASQQCTCGNGPSCKSAPSSEGLPESEKVR